MKSYLLISVLLLPYIFVAAEPVNNQNDSDSINTRRLKTVIIAGSTAYAGSLIALNQIWYKNQATSQFHFFNDNAEWNQVDKAGHAFSSYQMSFAGYKLNRWMGLSEKEAINIGALYGPVLLTSIEIFDGFSEGYGASYGDLIANATGSLLMWSQFKVWKGIRIHPKFSFHQTSYAPKRPELLGYNLKENIIKDYNGQTYWLSFDISEFAGKESRFPKWINIAAGYGADGMLFSRESTNNEMGYTSYRQYFLALDFDLSHIKSKKKWVNSLIFLVNMVHLPAPALEYNSKKGLVWHSVYF